MRELTPLEYLQVQARKNRPRVEKPPMVEPDAYCYAYDRPKAAFFTEGKAYKALEVTQQRRLAEGNPQIEKRFYECPFAHNLSGVSQKHFHLTSKTVEEYKEAVADVHQD